jgi:hypothetical protein
MIRATVTILILPRPLFHNSLDPLSLHTVRRPSHLHYDVLSPVHIHRFPSFLVRFVLPFRPLLSPLFSVLWSPSFRFPHIVLSNIISHSLPSPRLEVPELDVLLDRLRIKTLPFVAINSICSYVLLGAGPFIITLVSGCRPRSPSEFPGYGRWVFDSFGRNLLSGLSFCMIRSTFHGSHFRD